MIYVPNVGEMEQIKAEIIAESLYLGLYSNQVIADGNTTIDTLVELLSGGGRGYAVKALSNDVVLDALTADKWLISTNSQGKAEGQYHNAALSWVMAAADVADGKTVYGAFAYTFVVPFDAGVTEIKVGDVIKGATSGATGEVTQVRKFSGTWGSTAAGELVIKTKTGTFQNDENLIISGKVATVSIAVGGTGYALGDIIAITQTGAKGTKLAVTGVTTGAVTSVAVVEGGTGYSVASALATTNIVGSGTGCTINILTLSTAALAVSNTGVTGDAHKRLAFVDAFSEGHAIDTVGLTVEYTPKKTLSTA